MTTMRATIGSTIRTGGRWIRLPIALAAAAFYAVPRVMKRTFAPPQPDATRTPGDLGLPEEQVWLDSVNGTRLHGWFFRHLIVELECLGLRFPSINMLRFRLK